MSNNQSNGRITVVTVDDHHLTRLGIKSQIEAEPDMTVVGEGEAGDDVARLVKLHKPDVLLLDISMPQLPGIAMPFQVTRAVPMVKELSPDTSIIIISMHTSQTLLAAVLTRGVQGYLLKNDPLTNMLPQAIRTVDGGGIFLSPTLTERIYEYDDPTGTLTRRQKQIIMAIAEDPNLSYVEHAINFGITEGALKNRLSVIYSRLGVTNITACVIECVRQGIIAIPD